MKKTCRFRTFRIDYFTLALSIMEQVRIEIMLTKKGFSYNYI